MIKLPGHEKSLVVVDKEICILLQRDQRKAIPDQKSQRYRDEGLGIEFYQVQYIIIFRKIFDVH